MAPWTRAPCALRAEGECGRRRENKRRRRDAAQLHITRPDPSAAETSRPVGSCYRRRRRRTSTAREHRVSPNSVLSASRSGAKDSAVRWENDDVAVTSAPPFYVSKWRIGRLDRSRQVPCQRTLSSGTENRLPSGTPLKKKAVGQCQLPRELTVASWAWIERCTGVKSQLSDWS